MTGDELAAFPPAMRALHWVTAILVVVAVGLAWQVESATSHDAARRLVTAHRSVGLMIFVLTLVRLAVRLRSRVPPLPTDLSKAQRLAARASASLLYGMLFTQPIVGVLASWLHSDAVSIAGVVPLPSPFAPDRPLARSLFTLHGWIATAFLTLIALHIAAALHHHFVRRDSVLAAMLGVGAEPKREG